MPHIAYQRNSYNRYGAEGKADGMAGALTLTAGEVDVEALRERNRPADLAAVRRGHPGRGDRADQRVA